MRLPPALLSWRGIAGALLLAGLVAGTGLTAADGPTRPGAGPRPRRSTTTPPVPEPPSAPPADLIRQFGPDAHQPVQATPATDAYRPAAAPEAPPPDPLFDDRPTGSFEAITWVHTPSPQVVSTESYTEEACTRLLGDDTLPGTARAALLGGRARARTRMWRLETARIDVDAAIALDPDSAPLRLVHADLLACLGQADEADSVVQRAFHLDPESSLSARALGLVRFQQGSMQSAADALGLHLERTASIGTAEGDATLPLLRAVAADDYSRLQAVDDLSGSWTTQLTAFLCSLIDRDTLLLRARAPRGASADEAACTAWFYLGQRSLAHADKERATRDLLAAVRTGCTSAPEYRLAIAALTRLGALKADSLPGRLAE